MENLVRVTIQAGRSLASKDSNGFSDPFCTVGIVDNNGKFRKKKNTEVIKKTHIHACICSASLFKFLNVILINPNWGSEIFQFEIDFNFAGIKVECWDKDTLGKNFLGEVNISYGSLQENPNQEGWYNLERRKDKPNDE
jgi:hypothetical protein